MQMHRLFIAIPVPDGVKTELEKVQAELRGAISAGGVRWTKREQFHLTLRFLGDVAADRVEALARAVREVCDVFPPLRLRAERIGFFPDLRFPRVVWAWVHDEQELLPKLQEAIEAAAKDFTAEPAEKKFTGHITLARIKSLPRPQAELLAKMALGMTDRFFGEWTAGQVEIIRSELGPGGPRYTTVSVVPLGGDGVVE